MNPYRQPPLLPVDLVEEQAFADAALLRDWLAVGLLPPMGSRGVTPRMRARLAAGEPALHVFAELRPGGASA